MSHGPLMVDIAGTELGDQDREILCHPATGGVILFSRNYRSPDQVKALVDEIHGLREPSLLVAVDQEGGRVQRFSDGFTRLPPAAWFGKLYDENPKRSLEVTRLIGWLMASELRSVSVDFSFAPVLDLSRDLSQVIGDRSFHGQPLVVARLAQAWMQGVHEAGMPVVGKHFPGHGSVIEDSHETLPVDHRHPEDVMIEDLLPFEQMISHGMEAIMPAHVVYEKASPELAGFSRYWLQDILRGRLGFQGVIFSDDLTMAAAGEAGDYPERAKAALEAGCDMVLVCNNREGALSVLEALEDYNNPAAQMRLIRMHGRRRITREKMHLDGRWPRSLQALSSFDEHPAMDLDL